MQKKIKIEGARVHNLKNVDLELPLNKLICFFGPSGSGKTSLAFHTLYAESKRRFLNSFPTYLKFFSERPAPADVDLIEPVLPVFGLPQINPVVGTRANVADTMHLTELLQNHFFYYSKEKCPDHKIGFEEQPFGDFVGDICVDDDEKYYLLISKEDFLEYFANSPLPSRSVKSTRSKKIDDFNVEDKLWEISRFKRSHIGKLDEKLDPYLKLGLTIHVLLEKSKKLVKLSYKYKHRKCPVSSCEYAAENGISLMHFSPYNALGACKTCSGFGENLEYDQEKLVDINKSVSDDGVTLLNYKRFGTQKENLMYELKKRKISLEKPISKLPKDFWDILYTGAGSYPGFDAFFRYMEKRKYKMNVRIFVRNIQKSVECQECHGLRLGSFTEKFFIDSEVELNLRRLLSSNVSELKSYLNRNRNELLFNSNESKKSYKKIQLILNMAEEIGLGHLQLLRKSKTVSAGEYQRLLLLKYLSYEGTDSLFIFDEPSLGLAEKEMKSLLKGFKVLLEQNNTVVIIDHNTFFKKSSDYLVEMGPLAGHQGGEVLYSGERSDYKFKRDNHKFTPIEVTKKTWIKVSGSEIYGNKYPDFKVLNGGINLVLGTSGSGKSACLINILASELNYRVTGKHLDITKGTVKSISGDEKLEGVVVVDANLNRYTSRSTVGSMTELFTVIRKHYIKLPVAQAMGLKDGHLSFNSELGQCMKCGGRGFQIIEMQFLEDIKVECEDCNGKKIKSLYAELSDGRMTVHESFSKPIAEVFETVKLTPKFQRILKYLHVLNLDYLSLDRQVKSLSGGEIQRIYLLNKLQKNLENSIIFLENISFGLSTFELKRMGELLSDLASKGNTIVIIDQHPKFKELANNQIVFDK